MAIYQAPRRRWRLAIATAVLGALVGFGIGAVVMHHDPSPKVAIAQLDHDLDDIAALVGVVEVEYADARSGTASELRGARDALARARERYRPLSEAVAALAPSAARAISSRFAELDRLMAARRSAAFVGGRARSLAVKLRAVVGGASSR